LDVITGFRSYPSLEDPFYQGTYKIEIIKINAKYNPDSLTQDNDIAVLKTKTAIKFTRGVSPVCMPLKNTFLREDFYAGKTFELVGWDKYL
jgi:hypothetical protein